MTTGVAPSGARELTTTEVDGVRTFIVDTGQTPAAVLTFRVGLADETLIRRGWVHLVEHLAMHGRDNPSFVCNASVGMWSTEFQVQGETEDVVGFLEGVCAWLADPDFGDLDHERRILEAESKTRQTGDVGTHLDFRFGVRGVGALGWNELGLRTADEESLRALVRTYFTAGNAALAMNCQVPEGLRLPLPPGERVPIPSVVDMGLELPSHMASPTSDISVSGIVENAYVVNALAELLSRTIAQRLRRTLGSSYGTASHIERVDEDRLVLWLISDVTQERRGEGVEHVRRALEELRDRGITHDDLAPIVLKARRALSDDTNGAWQAFNSAASFLRGKEPVTVDRVADYLDQLDVEEVTVALKQFLATALYSSPTGGDSETSLPFSSGRHEAPAAGTPTTFKGWSMRDSSRLRVSEASVEVTSDEMRRCISFDEMVGYLVYPDGARVLVALEGRMITITPESWFRGDKAVALLDSHVPTHLHIPMDARDADQMEPSPKLLTRMTRPLTSWVGGGWVVVVGIYLLLQALLGLAVVVLHLPLGLFVGSSVAMWVGMYQVQRDERKKRERAQRT